MVGSGLLKSVTLPPPPSPPPPPPPADREMLRREEGGAMIRRRRSSLLNMPSSMDLECRRRGSGEGGVSSSVRSVDLKEGELRWSPILLSLITPDMAVAKGLLEFEPSSGLNWPGNKKCGIIIIIMIWQSRSPLKGSPAHFKKSFRSDLVQSGSHFSPSKKCL